MFYETVQLNTISTVLGVLLPSSRIYALYLLSALVLAFFVWLRLQASHRHEHAGGGDGATGEGRTGFLAYVFDRRIWTHKSTRQDIYFFFVNALIFDGLISQYLISVHAITTISYNAMVAWFGMLQAPLFDSWPAIIAYTFATVVLADFAIFLGHYVMHKVPVLWHFHKVHHSAETLNPLTLFRMHPVDLFITGIFVSLISGIGLAGLFYFTHQEPQELTILGLNIIMFLFYIFGYNLRHSHVWLSYPVWLSKWVISPAQHQIHHSVDPKHFDTNMGLVFSVWDRMFGTLYVPRGYEKIDYGIDRSEPNPFKSISDIYLKPFAWAWETMRETYVDRWRRAVVCSGMVAVVLAYAMMLTSLPAPKPSQSKGPHLEDMTWVEVRDAVAAGFDTVIIPTGGTEQNGPFVALGKHNLIMKRTAGEIARRVGHTLVAPVMAYVPEGSIEPAEGHMEFAGTLSLPEPVFEAVLEATARSLKVHGFRNILLVGESGDSQASQQRVADRLSREWGATDVRIATVDDYYARNGQVEWLVREKGLSEAEIGSHAGVRDMSETMFVSSNHAYLRLVKFPPGTDTGQDGRVSKASAAIGRKMVELKVEAATRQISALFSGWGRKPEEKRKGGHGLLASKPAGQHGLQ